MNPGLKWITGYVEDGTTELLKYPCDMALLPTLPSQQMCGGVIPGQDSSLLADGDGDNVPDTIDVDDDNDGLIEIRFLEDLDYVRHSLDGTNYDDEADDGLGNEGITVGAPTGTTGTACAGITTSTNLCGYELARDLDFDEDGSYRSGTVNTDWTGGTGWTPIGDNSTDDDTTRFAAIFDGNGHTIGDLRIARDITNVGLFGYIGGSGEVRNVALNNARVDYTGSSRADVGALAGESRGTIVVAAAIGGTVSGGEGNDEVGGLVGYNLFGTITASYASGVVDGGDGTSDWVGGLVGINASGTITASYATGMVDGGAGDNDNVGGLVGWNEDGGTITASYGFGTTMGGEDSSRAVDRSDDVSPAVIGASQLTAANSSTDTANRWSATVWSFGGTSQNPLLKWVTASNFSCDRTLLPTGQSCGGVIPGAERQCAARQRWR